jgi:LmbE family N-acetylglucosaminyl deacetylase
MSTQRKKLLCILAHPDDESLGTGGTLIKYASEGTSTYLLCATKGERGRFGVAKESPGLDIVGKTRAQELMNAAQILKLKEVNFLGYIDGDLDRADPLEISVNICTHIRRIRPQVIITFGPEGSYGHPDHIAISQFTMSAIVKAADQSLHTGQHKPHIVSKLYWIAWPTAKWQAYQTAFKELSMTVDGVKRIASPYPDWGITTRIEARKYWRSVWKAIMCHKTQMAVYRNLEKLTPEQQEYMWGEQEFFRAFSLVNGGRQGETDLFEGI